MDLERSIGGVYSWHDPHHCCASWSPGIPVGFGDVDGSEQKKILQIIMSRVPVRVVYFILWVSNKALIRPTVYLESGNRIWSPQYKKWFCGFIPSTKPFPLNCNFFIFSWSQILLPGCPRWSLPPELQSPFQRAYHHRIKSFAWEVKYHPPVHICCISGWWKIVDHWPPH